MSFAGYSGEGHAFNEIYDHRLAKWVVIHSFFSFHLTVRASGEPLSSLELRERLAAGEGVEQWVLQSSRHRRIAPAQIKRSCITVRPISRC